LTTQKRSGKSKTRRGEIAAKKIQMKRLRGRKFLFEENWW